MKFKFLIKIIFAAVLIKSILWAFLVPLWHTPDEQAHFGHVAFIAEGGDLARHGRYKDMTEEIYTSLEILGTKRDERGNNKFTFHPEYRLPYSQTVVGPEEEKIKLLPPATRKNFIIRESAYYPHLFYQVSSLIYKLFYPANLFIRVFTVRLFWLLAHWLTIWLIFKSTQLIFSKNKLMIVTITILAGFQPMFSFVASGVTSDNLYNLLFTTVIYLCLKIISQAQSSDFFWLALTLGLGMITKQQFFASFALIVPALLIALIKHPKKISKYLWFLPLAGVFAYLSAPARFSHLLKIIAQGQLPYLTFKSEQLVNPDYSLLAHFRWTITHTIREVLPWYWGVFNWLGVILPRSINQILMRLLGLAGLGLVIKFYQIIQKRQFNQTSLLLGFTAWIALSYFLALMTWDWTFIRGSNFSFGIQGRYYFPVITSHMILLAVGIEQIGQSFSQLLKKTITPYLLLLLNYWFIFLNLVGLYTVAKAYYRVNHWKIFIIQASQYKPWFAKGMFLTSTILLFFISQLILVYKLTKYAQKKS